MADKGINKFYEAIDEAISKAVVDGFSKAMSHPDIRISKKAKKLWEKYNG